MSYDYTLVNKEVRAVRLPMDHYAYREALAIACDHGWDPAWTLEPSDWRNADYEDSLIHQLALELGWLLPGSYDKAVLVEEGLLYFKFDPNKSWDGNYITPQGQVVTSQDAMAIAGALQRAIDSVSDYDTHIRRRTQREIAKVETEMEKFCEKDGRECPGYVKALATKHLHRGLLLERDLKEIIAFCRMGAFLICCG